MYSHMHMQLFTRCVYGSGVTSYCNSNGTALHHAVKLKQRNVVELLIKHGANVNTMDEFYRTPLEIYMNIERTRSPFELDMNMTQKHTNTENIDRNIVN